MRIFKTSKRTKIVIITIFLFFCLSFLIVDCVFAGQSSDLEKELSEYSNNQLDNLNFNSIDDFIEGLNGDQYKLFGQMSFTEKIKTILAGNFQDNQVSFLNYALKTIFSTFLNFLPTLVSVVVISIMCGMLSQMRPGFMSKSMGDIIYFVCYGVVIILVVNAVMQLMQTSSQLINSIKTQMNVTLPILLTLMTALGGVVSVKVYQPAIVLLSSGIINIISYVIFPLFIVSTVLTIVGNISDNIKISKLNSFFISLSKWILGIIFTIFLAFITIQGITAGSRDGISIRMAKYAVSNSIPILGGYIKDGFDLVLASSVLIKNSVGNAGVVLLFSSTLLPILSIVVFMFGLKLTAAIIEPIVDSKMTIFINSISKNIMMIIVAVVGVAFMYFILLMLLMLTCNVFF